MCDACGAEFARAGHASDTWETNSRSHWKECEICGGEFGIEDHASETWQTGLTQHAQTCDVCGREFNVGDHAADPDEWQSDETGHWKVCKDCGAEFARAEHDYGEDGACTECGYTQALQPDPPEQPEPTLPENRRAAPTRRG